ncbi:hypothetical protein ACWT_5852 [Actinoplanes sp. SE50]|uniref:hypothetical protein n=1 Tax=unclassified Actinoplanes TaxID=2626549 RepID=UPI00023EBDC8|nr:MULTISPECIES: hypothetical protein [unclassified Actinoplanes]AEV86870.1 hypothetical protein ACPL_5983 [Actinoplanes sp. SE50/110]ATO85267.1 hypothetical protein ACWT_5852 [Actinoplanes sp. SE50]SLM02677.1 hypothetical protein ACSP50_5959 [Actinoplanes sp. SE50/110]
MSTTTYAPPAGADNPDDFDRWEKELVGDTRHHFRPSKAALRREDQHAIDEALGYHRHRTNERRD